MANAMQMFPATAYELNAFETDSRLCLSSERSVATSCPSVLLVGRSGSWGSSVLKSLEKLGSELSYVPPQTATAEYVTSGAYALVLLDSTVSPEQRRELASNLIGSRSSIFYTFPVENGCWWLPALLHGQDCHGSPAFRRSEFPNELERVLRDPAES